MMGLRPSNKSDLGPSALGGKPNDIVKVLDLTILYDVELSKKKKKDCYPRAFGPQIKVTSGLRPSVANLMMGLRPSNKSDLGPSALGGKPNDIVKVLDLTILYDVELSKKKKDCRSVFLLSVFFFTIHCQARSLGQG